MQISSKFSKFSYARDIAQDLGLLTDNNVGDVGKAFLDKIK